MTPKGVAGTAALVQARVPIDHQWVQYQVLTWPMPVVSPVRRVSRSMVVEVFVRNATPHFTYRRPPRIMVKYLCTNLLAIYRIDD
jgi:hypothetical protein